jgi:ketosteroid isomerase-like protein
MSLARICAALLLLLSAVSFAQVREKDTAETREEKVRDLLEKFNEAYRQKDANALAEYVTADLTGFAGGKTFTSWNDYRDTVLSKIFSRNMPPSTWEIEKIVTTPEMAWAYTKTNYRARRQGQPVEADLYQVFVMQKLSAQSGGKSMPMGSNGNDWKIVVIDNSFHAAAVNRAQPGAQDNQPQSPRQRP